MGFITFTRNDKWHFEGFCGVVKTISAAWKDAQGCCDYDVVEVLPAIPDALKIALGLNPSEMGFRSRIPDGAGSHSRRRRPPPTARHGRTIPAREGSLR